MSQVPLDLRWPPHQRLDTFHPGANAGAWRAVSALAAEPGREWLFLYGAPGTGKSHLLLGACRTLLEAGAGTRYMSLARLPSPRAVAIAGIAAEDLIALDEVQAVAGSDDDQCALFDLYNRCRDAGARMLFAANAPPGQLGFGLPDLVSRLATCVQYPLQPLDDAGRRTMLRLLAGRLGLRLGDEVLNWWLARQPRDPASLVALLARVDRAALAAQRRVTIPFLRDLLRSDRQRV